MRCEIRNWMTTSLGLIMDAEYLHDEHMRMLLVAAATSRAIFGGDTDDYMDKLIDAGVITSSFDLEDNDVVYDFTNEALDELENWIGASDKELVELFEELIEEGM